MKTMPTPIETKENISSAIISFIGNSCAIASSELLNTLGYRSTKTVQLPDNTPETFLSVFNQVGALNKDKAFVDSWSSIEILFQITGDEIQAALGQNTLFTAGLVDNTNINSFLFFSVCLKDKEYTRTQLASITREVNKLFMMPVIIFFTYDQKLSIGIITRRLHKRDANKDVLDKVTLIKDINLTNPHRAHVEILFDLSLPQLQRSFPLNNFADLQTAWQKTLDVEELNKKFYKEIAYWYFWATQNVKFPVGDNHGSEENRNAVNVIRLITRIIFVWFLKEKQLIPEDLFKEEKLCQILKYDDPNQSTYYKAIMQNLFFATLNQEMNKPGKEPLRKFRITYNQPGSRNGNRLVTNLYRYERYFKDPLAALKLFESIPFLNGGLFECLDKEIEVDGQNKVLRIDGFSDENGNVLRVPDDLFFGKERDVDLNPIFNTTNKRYPAQGLFHILESYKFTVEENTPINEEVALDPELLGKVFENLLAAFNPETSTTARKATGSYYTPRPIVDYMVDESLIAYLKNYLMSQGVPEKPVDNVLVETQPNLLGENQPSLPAQSSLDERVRDLVSYTDSNHSFSDAESVLLVKAIDELNVLDPACGSGAFPMGILHKLVYILGKLDPENQIWQNIQLDKAVKETEEAYRIGDREERHQRIQDIEEAFDNNTSDYGRKLYLIESCLYGVDIQPIAVQIAKLRFFISLIVDQKVNPEKENLGIRPLPNLETKFVAANSLIGLDKPLQLSLQATELSEKESELAQIRHKLFSARTSETKRKYRSLDKQKRGEIRDLLVQSGWSNATASVLAAWDPYDQNTSSQFFDPEWMLGIRRGFDIVIGNPPYIQLQNNGGELANLYEDQKYKTFSRMGDIYCLFYERGFNLLKPNGHLCYITSNKWMRAGYGEKLRKFFSEETNPLILIDFAGIYIFESVTVDNTILLFNRSKNQKSCLTMTIGSDFQDLLDLSAYVAHHASYSSKFISNQSWVITSSIEDQIRNKIEFKGTPLVNWDISICYGIKTGYNEAFIINGLIKDELIHEDPKSEELIKPILRGRDIKRYKAEFADLWLISTFPALNLDINDYPAIKRYLASFGDKLQQVGEDYIDEYGYWAKTRKKTGNKWFETQDQIAYYLDFEKEKIVWAELARTGNSFILDSKKFYSLAGTFILTLFNGDEEQFSYKYLVSMLNHPTTLLFLEYVYSKLDVTGWQWKKEPFEKIPIPRASQGDQNIIINVYDEYIKAPHNQKLNLLSKLDKIIFDYFGFTNEEIKFTFEKLKVFSDEQEYFNNYILS